MTIPSAKKPKASSNDFSAKLLNWYDINARQMPWRIMPADSKKGIFQDPYFTWLSEVMLQQTQVATVKEYFLKFITNWPTVNDLTNADEEDVLKAWAGLGYYSRARNLKKCADIIVADYDGLFPQTVDELLKLPGIGDYTASAISSIAFGKAVPVVDGNVERVIARVKRIKTPILEAKPQIRKITNGLLDKKRGGDFAQAMMDLGATICMPKKPDCSLCPVEKNCQAYSNGDMETYPVKLPKKVKPTRKGAAFVIVNLEGAIYLQKRKDKGLLAGMSEVPTSEWNSNEDGALGIKAAPFERIENNEWQVCKPIKHTFTHFHLELEVWTIRSNNLTGNGWWSAPDEIGNEALPTVFTKVIHSALKHS